MNQDTEEWNQKRGQDSTELPKITSLYVDGGMTVNNLLLQLQANLLEIQVGRYRNTTQLMHTIHVILKYLQLSTKGSYIATCHL